MSEYTYGGAADIDRAIGTLVGLDDIQKNALAVIEFDQAIDELQQQYELATADAAYVPSDDFIARLSGYLELADDRDNPDLD
ncbi:hypothetical protein BH11ACT2_BH11ACT2_09050 [soil metagenome]